MPQPSSGKPPSVLYLNLIAGSSAGEEQETDREDRNKMCLRYQQFTGKKKKKLSFSACVYKYSGLKLSRAVLIRGWILRKLSDTVEVLT